VILIFTLGRVQRQVTLRSIPPQWYPCTRLVVQAHEAKLHRDAGFPVGVLVLPPHIRTISPTRQWAIEWAHARNVTRLVTFDDDLTFARRAPGGKKLVQSTPDDVHHMLEWMFSSLATFAGVGVSTRGENYFHDGTVKHATKLTQAMGFRTDILTRNRLDFDRVAVGQDTDMTLQLLRAGYCTAVNFEHTFTHAGGHNAKGGCSTYRTLEFQHNALVKLHELHKDFTRLVTRTIATHHDGKPHTLLRVRYRKAYLSGLPEELR
jgi:hypothetical protein